MKVPLFDIDKTLIGGLNIAHGQAFAFALDELLGIKDADIGVIKPPGKIDSQIFVETAVYYGVDEARATAVLDDAYRLMAEYFVQHVNANSYKPMDSVVEFLEILKKDEFQLGLLTGNVEAIAWKKLTVAGINNYFSFGAFGNLAFRRPDLVDVALTRAQKINEQIKKSDLVIIGDTPLDVACALTAGIEVIGVSAGDFSVKELAEAGANLVVESFAEHGKLLAFLNN